MLLICKKTARLMFPPLWNQAKLLRMHSESNQLSNCRYTDTNIFTYNLLPCPHAQHSCSHCLPSYCFHACFTAQHLLFYESLNSAFMLHTAAARVHLRCLTWHETGSLRLVVSTQHSSALYLQDVFNCLVLAETVYKVQEGNHAEVAATVAALRQDFPADMVTLQRLQWSLPHVPHRSLIHIHP